MKSHIVLTVLILCMIRSSAQDFPGYRSGSYSGVNGVFFNPASIADSRYRFDVNLFSVSVLAGNDQASFSLKNFSESFKGDSLKNQLFGKDAGPSSGMMSLDVHGPSVMFNINKKSSLAITTRARVFANVVNIDGKLVNEISDDFNNDPDLPYTISSNQNMRVAVNAWSEFGLSYARVIAEEGAHFFKGGITLKYLGGAGNGFINIDNFNGTINDDVLVQDGYLSNTTGRIATGFGGINISAIEDGELTKMKGSGVGADIGFVYEFRPGTETAAEDQEDKKETHKTYRFKFGVSVLDIGRIRYKKDTQKSGAYDINITNGEKFYLEQLSDLGIDDYNDFFGSQPQYFTPVTQGVGDNYSVSLPSTLQLDADYHLHRGWYVNLASQFALANIKNKGYNNQSYSSITLAPRYEGRRFGFYLPLNYNELTKFNAGVSFRFGPVFIGSGSVLTALAGESKQADVHFGLRFGGLR